MQAGMGELCDLLTELSLTLLLLSSLHTRSTQARNRAPKEVKS